MNIQINSRTKRQKKQSHIFSERKRNKDSFLASNKIQIIQQKKFNKTNQKFDQNINSRQICHYQSKDLEQIEEDSQIPKPRQYTTVDFQKQKDIFKYVNSTWVEAQKTAQREKGIQQSQRLSSIIVVRIFNNKKICVDLLDKQKKMEISRMCSEMGAKLKKDVEDYSLLITDRLDTQRSAIARKLKGVKILRPNFVTQCRQCQAYLDEKEYII